MLFSKCVHYFCVQNTLQKNNLHVGSLIFTSQFESMLSILEKKKNHGGRQLHGSRSMQLALLASPISVEHETKWARSCSML